MISISAFNLSEESFNKPESLTSISIGYSYNDVGAGLMKILDSIVDSIHFLKGMVCIWLSGLKVSAE